MAWRYPKYHLKKNRPTSIDELNTNMAGVACESGRLNEHNWKEQAITDKSVVNTGASTFITGTYRGVDMIDITPPGPFWSSGSTVQPSYTHAVLGDIDWVLVDSIDFKSDNSLVWINASFQQVRVFGGTADDKAPQYGLRIDGAIIDESVTGTGERSNDRFSFWPNYTVPIVLDAIVPVPSGSHTIELVVRVGHGAEFMKTFDNYGVTYITSRELFAVELRR